MVLKRLSNVTTSKLSRQLLPSRHQALAGKKSRSSSLVTARSNGKSIAVVDSLQLEKPKNRLLLSFLAFVLMPTLVAFVYISFFQSRQYLVEAKLVVRSSTEQKSIVGSDTLSLLSKLGGSSSSKSTVGDGFIIADYIRGRTVVVDLGGKDFLKGLFARPEIDRLSRLTGNASFEDAWKYWNKHVNATLDTISGVISLRVRAFSPQDSVLISQKVIDLSEKIINEISDRSRHDAQGRAESEVRIAAEKLSDARRDVLNYRNAHFLIDPSTKAKLIGELLGKLNVKRIEVENNLASLEKMLDITSPSQRLLATQLAVIDRQIGDLKQQLTGDDKDPRVSAEIGQFEQLKLKETFAERLYQIAQSTYEKARTEAAKQQLFLVTVVKPMLPEDPLVPQIGVDTFLFFSIAMVLWGIGTLLLASVRDHFE